MLLNSLPESSLFFSPRAAEGGFLARLFSYLAPRIKGLGVYTGDFLFLCTDGWIFIYFFERYPLGGFGDRLGSDNETGRDGLADTDGRTPDLERRRQTSAAAIINTNIHVQMHNDSTLISLEEPELLKWLPDVCIQPS